MYLGKFTAHVKLALAALQKPNQRKLGCQRKQKLNSKNCHLKFKENPKFETVEVLRYSGSGQHENLIVDYRLSKSKHLSLKFFSRIC